MIVDEAGNIKDSLIKMRSPIQSDKSIRYLKVKDIRVPLRPQSFSGNARLPEGMTIGNFTAVTIPGFYFQTTTTAPAM